MKDIPLFSHLLSAIEYYSCKAPNKTCLIEGESGKKLSYREFWENISQFASLLKSKGLQKGDRVALYTCQTIGHLVAFFGTQLAGCVAIPIAQSTPSQLLSELVLHFEVGFIVAANNIDGISHNIILHGEHKNIPFSNTDVSTSDLNVDDLALILYTTGTTGKSKGVMLSLKNRLAGAENTLISNDITSHDIALAPLMLSHSATIRRIEAMLLSGATTVIMESAVFVADVFSVMKKYSVSVLHLVPAQIALMLRSAEKLLTQSGKQLRALVAASALLPENHKEKLRELLPNVQLYIDYGTTEAVGSATFEWSKYTQKPYCMGLDNKHSRIVFLDENNELLEKTSKDYPGVIATEGDTVMLGYWKDSELTNSVLFSGRFISNDVGYRDNSDGLIYLIGRKDNTINYGGKKISPYEIEDFIADLDGIKECVVISKEDNIMGNIPVLFVVMENGHEFSASKIQSIMKEHLEKFKVPKAENIIEAKKLPRADGTGKVLRKSLLSRLSKPDYS